MSLKNIQIIIFALLIVPLSIVLYHYSQKLYLNNRLFFPTITGLLMGIIFERRILSSGSFLRVWEHENTHLLTLLIFLKRPSAFIVRDDEGGAVVHNGGWIGENFIGLAPYFLPTATFLFLPFYPFVNSTGKYWLCLFIGFSLGYHLTDNIRDTFHNWTSEFFCSADGSSTVQSDIGGRGFLYSSIYIVTMTLFFYGLIFSFILKGPDGIPGYFIKLHGVIYSLKG